MNRLCLLSTLLIFLNSIKISSQSNPTDLKCPGGIPTCLYMDKKIDTFYAGCWGGIWKYNSTQNDWTEVDADPDSNILANAKITAMAIDSKGVFYAGTDGNTQSYISFDGGKKWSQIQNSIFTLQNVKYIMEHPNGSVYFATDFGILKTSDHGKTWENLKNAPSNASCLFANSKGSIYAGVSSGMFTTNGNDTTWSRVPLPGPYLAVYTSAINSQGIIFAGAYGDIFKSIDDGVNWLSLRGTDQSKPTVNCLEISNTDIIYGVMGYGGSLVRFDDNGKSLYTLPFGSFMFPNWSCVVTDSKGILYGLSTRYGALKIVDVSVGVEKEEQLPILFSLSQNYPNPFNPSTTIKFSVPVETRHASSLHVLLKVYDLLGREVATLVNEEKAPGNYEVKFDVETFHGTSLPSGVYFYTLSTNGFFQSKKMLLVK